MTRLAFVLVAALLSGCAQVTSRAPATPPPGPKPSLDNQDVSQRSLKPFGSLEELRQQMTSVVVARKLADEDARAMAALCEEQSRLLVTLDSVCQASVAQLALADTRVSITNNQHEGVDEGDIVKRAGDVLIVLRRGRLFT